MENLKFFIAAIFFALLASGVYQESGPITALFCFLTTTQVFSLTELVLLLADKEQNNDSK